MHTFLHVGLDFIATSFDQSCKVQRDFLSETFSQHASSDTSRFLSCGFSSSAHTKPEASPSKHIKEIAKTVGVDKNNCFVQTSSLWCAQYHQSPRGSWKRTVINKRQIFPLVKINHFTTASQIKNTIMEGGISVSKSTIKRRLTRLSNYRQLTTRRRLPVSSNIILWTREHNINFHL